MRKPPPAFSLVEVTIALGILGFVILAVVGLLSVGLKSNQVSIEETRAALLLTMLEADLRNTHPGLNGSGKSAIFQLDLPYATNAQGYTFNPGLTAGAFSTTGVNDAELPVPLNGSRPRFQTSVTYLEVPPVGSLKPILARLIVNWPGTNTTNSADVLNQSKLRGAVEALVSFPAP